MRRAVVLSFLLASCDGDGGGSTTPDAPSGPPIDARPYGRGENCVPGPIYVSCFGSEVTVTYVNVAPSPMWQCSMPPRIETGTCASGCAVEGRMYWGQALQTAFLPPQTFCNGAPAAVAGQPCGLCVPTRAVLAGDGTVMSMTYLRCEAGVCVDTPAPTVSWYLQPCSVDEVTPHAAPGVNGLSIGVELCLIAWDSSAGAVRTGRTIQCMGDWYCPQGSLCDDDLPRLDPSPGIGVCKPGPRGTLTPAMLLAP